MSELAFTIARLGFLVLLWIFVLFLVLNDSYASSHHARVFPKDGSWWLEDLNSTNGTTLAGRAVHGAVELPVGVPVRIGQTTLELRP